MALLIARWFSDDDGSTAIEYAMIAALIALLLVTALTTVGGALSTTFNSVGDKIESN